MKRNMGTADRLLRAFLIAPAAGATALAVGATTVWGIVAWVVAGIMLVTAITAFCPIYALVGISTHRRDEVRHRPERDLEEAA